MELDKIFKTFSSIQYEKSSLDDANRKLAEHNQTIKDTNIKIHNANQAIMIHTHRLEEALKLLAQYIPRNDYDILSLKAKNDKKKDDECKFGHYCKQCKDGEHNDDANMDGEFRHYCTRCCEKWWDVHDDHC